MKNSIIFIFSKKAFPAIFMNQPSNKINKNKTQLGLLFFTENNRFSEITYIQLDFVEIEQ